MNYKAIINLLNTEISFRHLYFDFLASLTGLKNAVNINSPDFFQAKVRNIDSIIDKNPVIREFNPIYVLVKEKTIPYEVKFNDNPEWFKISLPNYREIPQIFTQIKWITSYLNLNTVFRNYPLALFTEVKRFSTDEISIFKRLKLNSFDRDTIKLDRRLRIMEEITKISPYTRLLKREKLYDIPIIKKPVSKAYFSQENMAYFREILAKQGRTRSANVEILNIFDKLNIEVFSSIKQDPKTRDLICYPRENNTVTDKEKIYFLVIGQRKDTKVILKVLARLEN